ncbi:MAG: cytochrome C biogenesis protein CcmH [SAR324 cluster bacterium]|uniref:Cytochrome c-type biogenesis protein n=1 Tax=SAR324 cluster bacterium TaxID=2024889 RepID=A0A2A4T682_9DELT|nr:MAG: cytochrome C biogenesis protein CcmH [SAR324 cluster bacterium]
MKKLIFLGLLLFLSTAFSGLQADELDDQVRQIAHKLRCPTCQGLSVKESEAGLADNMKAKIRSLLEEGKTEEEILQFFVDRYGEWILRSPQMKGFNLLLWLAPGTLIFLTCLILFFKMRQKSITTLKPEAINPLNEEELAQIEKELQNLNRN